MQCNNSKSKYRSIPLPPPPPLRVLTMIPMWIYDVNPTGMTRANNEVATMNNNTVLGGTAAVWYYVGRSRAGWCWGREDYINRFFVSVIQGGGKSGYRNKDTKGLRENVGEVVTERNRGIRDIIFGDVELHCFQLWNFDISYYGAYW